MAQTDEASEAVPARGERGKREYRREKPAGSELAEWGGGHWRKLNARDARVGLSAEQRAELEALEALGYADGAQPRRATGVTIADLSNAQPGFNLYSSGHAPEAILMDMQGRELHRWSYSFRDIWPKRKLRPEKIQAMWWRRVQLLENGDLIALFEGLGIIRLSARSELIWANPIAAHHDIEVLPDGDLLILSRLSHTVRRINRDAPIVEDFITLLGADGQEKHSLSLLEAVERSRFRSLLDEIPKRSGDLFHSNSLELLDGRLAHHGPEFAAGRLLISMRNLHVIATLDLERGQLVWLQQGSFKQQHDPTALHNGNILLFDNTGRPGESSVQEIDPASGEVVWEYRGSAEAPLYSHLMGVARRLPNGNTLITESEAGRALEVNSQGEIVWEFYTPYHAGSQQEFIASLSEVIRLPLDFPLDWLEEVGEASR